MTDVPTDTHWKRARPSKIEDLQPLAWDVTAIPDSLRSVSVLRLPPHWVNVIRGLGEVDQLSPVASLYAVLRVLAPEILYFFPFSFAEKPERRPPYWIVAEGGEAHPRSERLMWAIQGWLNACYGSEAVRSIMQHLHASDLQWEDRDLQQTINDEITRSALPSLLGHWLVQNQLQLTLSNEEDQRVTFPLRFAPSHGPEADLVTWPPTSIVRDEEEYSYSYYLKFRLGSLPDSHYPRLLCQPGISRWVSHSLVRRDKQGKEFVDLPWGRGKSVFLALKSASWLTQRRVETSLLHLSLRRYQKLFWEGRLSTVLTNLVHDGQIPEPLQLLELPAKFQPNALVSYDTMLNERHLVGAGIEEVDRWEIYTQLRDILPREITPSASFQKLKIYQRLEPSFAATFPAAPASIRRQGIGYMRGPALIEICSPDAEYWEEIVLKELGLESTALMNGQVQVMTDTGVITELTITKRAFRQEFLEELAPQAGEDDESRLGATRARVRLLEKGVNSIDGNAGVLLELPNYQEYYKDPKQRRRDPKLALQWGFARTRRKLQTIQPERADVKNYEERVRNGVRDLLRQMDFHLNPLYNGFKGTSLPSSIDILSFWQIRLKARKRGESAVTLPLLVHAPAGEYGFYICLPSDEGPHWYPYSDALMLLPDFSGGHTTPEATRMFLRRAVQDRGLTNSTLLLINEQNARDVFTELRDEHIQIDASGWRCNLPLGEISCRVARLRYSSHGTVPLVCPTHSFGKFSGLFRDEQVSHVFYSFQERPLSAKRPTSLHQRDAQEKHSWNPSTVEIVMLNMFPEDKEDEWAWLIHRLREESSHTSNATLFPEPLYSASKAAEYVLRVADELT